MKSYTSLEQSKKLAEFLPIESADVHWQYIEEDNGQLQWFCFPKDFSINENESILAWSLNSLIYILPDTITDEDGTIFGLNIKKNFIEYYNPSMGALYATYHSIIAEDLVDACYEMILKLHELKML